MGTGARGDARATTNDGAATATATGRTWHAWHGMGLVGWQRGTRRRRRAGRLNATPLAMAATPGRPGMTQRVPLAVEPKPRPWHGPIAMADGSPGRESSAGGDERGRLRAGTGGAGDRQVSATVSQAASLCLGLGGRARQPAFFALVLWPDPLLASPTGKKSTGACKAPGRAGRPRQHRASSIGGRAGGQAGGRAAATLAGRPCGRRGGRGADPQRVARRGGDGRRGKRGGPG